MRVSDLQLDDYVEIGGSIHQVKALQEGKVGIHKRSSSIHCSWYPESLVNPIPITEDTFKTPQWKCRVEKGSKVFDYNPATFVIYDGKVFTFATARPGYSVIAEIRYLHELQHKLKEVDRIV